MTTTIPDPPIRYEGFTSILCSPQGAVTVTLAPNAILHLTPTQAGILRDWLTRSLAVCTQSAETGTGAVGIVLPPKGGVC